MTKDHPMTNDHLTTNISPAFRYKFVTGNKKIFPMNRAFIALLLAQAIINLPVIAIRPSLSWISAGSVKRPG